MGSYIEGSSRGELARYGGGGLLHANRANQHPQGENVDCTAGNCGDFQRILPVDNVGNIEVLLSDEFVKKLPNPNGGDVFNAMAPLFGKGADQQCVDAFFDANALYIQRTPDPNTHYYEFLNPNYGKPNILPNIWFTVPKVCLEPGNSRLTPTGQIPPTKERIATWTATPTSVPIIATPSYPEESNSISAQEKPIDQKLMVMSVLGGVVGVVALTVTIKSLIRRNRPRFPTHATTPIVPRDREPRINSHSTNTGAVLPNQTVVKPQTSSQIQEKFDHIDAVFASKRLPYIRATKISPDGIVEVRDTRVNPTGNQELRGVVNNDRTLLEQLTLAAGSKVDRIKVSSAK